MSSSGLVSAESSNPGQQPPTGEKNRWNERLVGLYTCRLLITAGSTAQLLFVQDVGFYPRNVG